jgi:DNA modification methylase
MSKKLEDIKNSLSERKRLIQLFEGNVIESIMVHNRNDKAIDLTADRRRAFAVSEGESMLDNIIGDFDEIVDKDGYKGHLRVTYQGSRGKGKGLSRFPQNICRKVVKFYTKEWDTVVDPFAGHNSRFQAVFSCNRHYYGQDLCHEFMEDNFKAREMLLAERKGKLFLPTKVPILELVEGDSRKLPWPDNFGDFTITSPPYWHLEDYGPEKEQLGTIDDGSYESFLEGLKQVAAENYRVLKPGSYCVWFIQDFRYDGRFYNYHGDTIRIMEEVGFKQQDIIISDLGPSFRATFFVQCFNIKVIPKRHEYGVVMYKPK